MSSILMFLLMVLVCFRIIGGGMTISDSDNLNSDSDETHTVKTLDDTHKNSTNREIHHHQRHHHHDDIDDDVNIGDGKRELEPSITTIQWDHSIILDAPDDDSYHLFWTPRSRDILFRLEVRTLGYVGFGLSKNGRMAGADIVVGWVDRDGQPFLQDRHGITGHDEPILDKKQNYHLLSGFENETHTVLVFKRKYDTCDKHDMKITNDTWRVIYAYDDRDPESNAIGTTNITRHQRSQRGTKSIILTQHIKLQPNEHQSDDNIIKWDLLSNKVLLPEDDDTLYWCKLFKLPANIKRKNHMIGFVPVIQSGNDGFMHHVLMYECRSRTLDGEVDGETIDEFERLIDTEGHLCYEPTIPTVLKSCDKLIGVWAIGSEGFFMPPDMGYPLDPDNGATYFMMEVHYDNPYLKDGVKDSSGMRLFYTPNLRPIDAGILSIGIDPNWKHLIPPRQSSTVSYGHCIGKCTEKAFPVDGVHVFAAVLHSHSIGKKMQLRHVRGGDTELSPIVVENNYDPEYQEYRIFKVPIKILPGDHLIAECTYNSRGLDRMTQGGFTTREEMCLIFIYYHPPIDMSVCHSVPTLTTVHASVGVKEVFKDRIPAVIKSPTAYANRTLAEHMAKYDWSKNMKLYREVTKMGSFEVICGKHHGQSPALIESGSHYYPNITNSYREPKACISGRHGAVSQPEVEHKSTIKKSIKTSTTTTKTPVTIMSSERSKVDDIQRKKPPSTSAAAAHRSSLLTILILTSIASLIAKYK